MEIESSFVAPAVTEAPATPAATPASEPPSTAEPGTESTPPEGESPVEADTPTLTQKKFDEVLGKRLAQESKRLKRVAEAEARAEFAERQLAQLITPPQQQQSLETPKPADFQDWESYNRALVKHEARIEAQQLFDSYRQQSEAQQQQQFATQRAAQILPKVQAAQAKYDDFAEVATSFNAPRPMQEAMMESEIPGELYYYYGQNPQELDRVSRLSPVQQVKEIAKLETKLTAAPSPTRVPAPIKPDSGGTRVTKKLSEMTQDEFDKARAAYRKRR